MINDYYIYEYVRLDTNEPFYIGKGKKNRCYDLKYSRNKYFKNIVNNREVAVVILENNLDEKTAYQYECWYINEYKNLGYPLVNICDGGEGVTLLGEKNPMYGKSPYDNKTDEEKEEYKNKISKNHADFKGLKCGNAKRVLCIFPNGDVSNVMTIKDLAEYLGIERNTLAKMVNGLPYKIFTNMSKANKEHLLKIENIRILTEEAYNQEKIYLSTLSSLEIEKYYKELDDRANKELMEKENKYKEKISKTLNSKSEKEKKEIGEKISKSGKGKYKLGFICIFPNGDVSNVMTRNELCNLLNISSGIPKKLAKSKEPYKSSRSNYKHLEGIRILHYEDYLQELEQAS